MFAQLYQGVVDVIHSHKCLMPQNSCVNVGEEGKWKWWSDEGHEMMRKLPEEGRLSAIQ